MTSPARDTSALHVRRMARVLLVSAIASGQGKTTVTAALARRFIRDGQRVRVFKVGADFLDPAMLTAACGAPVETLDLWLLGEDDCRARIDAAACAADIVLIEGVMGLYDGEPSSADLARVFDLPVLGVLDASAMAQTVGALAQGLRDYGPVRLAGVIANRIAGPGHAALLAPALRSIPLLGSLPQQPCGLPERHLGLLPPAEVPGIDALLDAAAAALVLDAAAWSAIAPWQAPVGAAPAEVDAQLLRGRVVAIARDAAFAFLYPANVACLQAMGAQVVWFSPLADEAPPPSADAIYLPGGYPELHAGTLAGAARWRAAIQHAHAAGVPLLAECGGMMALCDGLQDAAGRVWPMAGLLAGTARMQTRLAAIGPQSWPTSHGELRGHAFHYSVFDTGVEPDAFLRCHPSGARGEAVYRRGSLTASYFHAWFASCPAAVAAIFSRQG